MLGSYVKGYTFKNDGINNIYILHNTTSDVLSSDINITERFSEVLPNEELKIQYNRKKIRNISVVTTTGTSDYRLWLYW